MAGFADAIKAFAEKSLKEVDKKCYSIFWQVSTNTVYFSPSPNNPGETSKGLLANQWYPEVGGGFSSELTDSTSPYGSDSLARINSLSGQQIFYGRDNTVTLTNNVPYAQLAETYGWQPPRWSGRVGPYKMVALSIQKVVAENN